jgi:hypothetical protein
MAEIIDDLGLAGCGRQDERGPLPISEAHSVVFQNPVRTRHLTRSFAPTRGRIGAARENTRAVDGRGPVLRSA